MAATKEQLIEYAAGFIQAKLEAHLEQKGVKESVIKEGVFSTAEMQSLYTAIATEVVERDGADLTALKTGAEAGWAGRNLWGYESDAKDGIVGKDGLAKAAVDDLILAFDTPLLDEPIIKNGQMTLKEAAIAREDILTQIHNRSSLDGAEAVIAQQASDPAIGEERQKAAAALQRDITAAAADATVTGTGTAPATPSPTAPTPAGTTPTTTTPAATASTKITKDSTMADFINAQRQRAIVEGNGIENDPAYRAALAMEAGLGSDTANIRLSSPLAQQTFHTFGLQLGTNGVEARTDVAAPNHDASQAYTQTVANRSLMEIKANRAMADISQYLSANGGKGANQYISYEDEATRTAMATMLVSHASLKADEILDSSTFDEKVAALAGDKTKFNAAFHSFQDDKGFRKDAILGPESMLGIAEVTTQLRAPLRGTSMLTAEAVSTAVGDIPHTKAMTDIVYGKGETFERTDTDAVKALEGQLALIKRGEALAGIAPGTALSSVPAGAGFETDGTLSKEEIELLNKYRGSTAEITDKTELLNVAQMQALFKDSGAAHAGLLAYQAGIRSSDPSAAPAAPENVEAVVADVRDTEISAGTETKTASAPTPRARPDTPDEGRHA